MDITQISFQELIDCVYRIVGTLEKKVDSDRQSDIRAVNLAHADMKLRLDGFPQQYSTKEELEAVAEVVKKLDRETVARQIYDTAHKALEDEVAEKLDTKTFNTFVENYRLDQKRESEERQRVAEILATTTARAQGSASTWKLQAAIVAAGVGIITIVVLLANNVFH